MFWEISPAAAYVADYLEYIAPKSPQKHLRPVSVILPEQIVNQAFKLV